MSFRKWPSPQSAPNKDDLGGKSKEAAAADQTATLPDQKAVDEMAKYGITRVPVDYFHYGVFRYTNLKDAMAQAKRTIQR
jgi:hypothetical protein